MTFDEWLAAAEETHGLPMPELLRLEAAWHAGQDTPRFRFALGQRVVWDGHLWIIERRRYSEGRVSEWIEYLLSGMGDQPDRCVWADEPDMEEAP